MTCRLPIGARPSRRRWGSTGCTATRARDLKRIRELVSFINSCMGNLYDAVFFSSGTVAVWRPNPPPGYVAIGHVITPNHAPPAPSSVACVRVDLAAPSSPAPAPLWTTAGAESKLGTFLSTLCVWAIGVTSCFVYRFRPGCGVSHGRVRWRGVDRGGVARGRGYQPRPAAVRDSMGRRVGGSSGGRGRIGIELWVGVVC